MSFGRSTLHLRRAVLYLRMEVDGGIILVSLGDTGQMSGLGMTRELSVTHYCSQLLCFYSGPSEDTFSMITDKPDNSHPKVFFLLQILVT